MYFWVCFNSSPKEQGLYSSYFLPGGWNETGAAGNIRTIFKKCCDPNYCINSLAE